MTFGLLMARAQDIPLDKGIAHAALSLRDTNTLIGTALRLLTDDPQTQKAPSTATSTLTRVLHEVHWPTLSKGRPDAWLYFYEDFLEVYDNALRKKTGSYYTPPEVVQAMVRLTDEALRDPALFGGPAGLAATDVTIADPATGTGTFLLGVLRKIAETVAEDQGEGAVGPALGAAAHRLIGFELQFGPFAVAQLRLMAEMRALMGATATGSHGNLPQPRLYVTDTLGDPYAAQTGFSTTLALINEYGTLIYLLLFGYCALKSGSLPLFGGYAAQVWRGVSCVQTPAVGIDGQGQVDAGGLWPGLYLPLSLSQGYADDWRAACWADGDEMASVHGAERSICLAVDGAVGGGGVFLRRVDRGGGRLGLGRCQCDLVAGFWGRVGLGVAQAGAYHLMMRRFLRHAGARKDHGFPAPRSRGNRRWCLGRIGQACVPIPIPARAGGQAGP